MRELRDLFNRGCDAAGIDPTRRHYHGALFTPPDPVRLYARETLISGAEFGTGNATAQSVGIYQIDVYAPMADGTRELTDAVDAIRAVCTPGIKSAKDGLQLAIDAASVLTLSQDERTIQLPISITYRTWRTP